MVELVAYQHKDVAQTWYNKWRDSKVIGGDPMNWESI